MNCKMFSNYQMRNETICENVLIIKKQSSKTMKGKMFKSNHVEMMIFYQNII